MGVSSVCAAAGSGHRPVCLGGGWGVFNFISLDVSVRLRRHLRLTATRLGGTDTDYVFLVWVALQDRLSLQ